MSSFDYIKYAGQSTYDAALDIRTTEVLMRLGIPASCKGYAYLRCSVILVYHTPEIAEYATKTLYPKVARLCRAAGAAIVERNCRHAMEYALAYGNRGILHELFEGDRRNERPTCAQFITAVARYLHEREKICEKE